MRIVKVLVRSRPCANARSFLDAARLLAGPDGAAEFAFHVEGAVLEHLVRDLDQGRHLCHLVTAPRTVRATYSSKRPVVSRSRSYRLVSGNGGNQDSRR